MIRKRLLCLLAVLGIGGGAALAQPVTEIRGRALDSVSGEPLVGIMVTVTPVEGTGTLAYGVSGSDGTFTLRRQSGFPERVKLTARSMVTKTLEREIATTGGPIELRLEEGVQQLNEVRIQAPRIEERGDTLNYNVESFRDSTDRSIGDVLKKLPGIQVTSGGQIIYQNRAISKFYVEGLDLLQGRYGLATNNIDASKVATVQVLEHHQPIRVLVGEEIPEEAAINIKLKKSALGAFFLTAQAGLGVPLWLLSNELVGMRFGTTQQNMLVYKGDNTGRDVVQEMTSYYGASTGTAVNLFQVERPARPSVDAQYTLFNDAHIGSANDLRMLGKGYTLTTNLNYLYDRQHSEGTTERHITVDGGAGDVFIAETLANRLLKRELNGTLTLEKNTSELFETNRLDFFVKRGSEESSVSGSSSVLQNTALPSFSIEDNYRRIWNTARGRRLTLEASLIYGSQDHSLEVDPILYPDLAAQSSSARQDVSYDQFESSFYIAWSRKMKGNWSMNFRAGGLVQHHTLESGMLAGTAAVQADSLRNSLQRLHAGALGMFSLGYVTRKISFTLNVPVRAQYLETRNLLSGDWSEGLHPLLDPNMSFIWRPSTRWTLMLNGLRNESYGTILDDMTGYLMRSYRSLTRGDGQLHRLSRTSGTLTLSYRNPFNSLFSSLSLNYVNNHRNYISGASYDGILSTITTLWYPNDSDTYRATMNVGYTFDALKTEARFGISYNGSTGKSLNQGILSRTQSDAVSISPSFITTISRRLIFQYNATLGESRHRVVGRADFQPARRLSQSFSLAAMPRDGWSLNISVNHSYNSLLTLRPSYWFANAGLRYKKDRTEIRLDYTNLLGNNLFETYSYSDVVRTRSTYRLRPAELLLRVNFSIF